MKRTPLVSQGLLTRRALQAQAAWARKDFQGAIELLESADRLSPANPGILIELGRAHGLRYNYAIAERYFEKTLRFAPRKSEMLMAIAEHSRYFRNPELHERYLRIALAQPDVKPNAFIRLAELLESLRRLPEAEEMAHRALKLDPSHSEAFLFLAHLERLHQRMDAAERILRSLIAKPIPNPEISARIWYELATVLDRQERFDDAMDALLQAKAQLRPHGDPLIPHLENYFSSLKKVESGISSGLLKRWQHQGTSLQPPRRIALLCGHARSGTTLLEQVLDSHPEIVSAEETYIFQDDALGLLERKISSGAGELATLDMASQQVLQMARDTYSNSMDLSNGKALGNRLLIDKNPMLTRYVPAFIRIFPEAKFIVAMRDPRDVVLSCFMQPHPLNPATAAFLDLKRTAEFYCIFMGFWQKLASLLPAPVLEVRYENMVTDLECVARRTLDFLNVPWDNRILAFYETARQKRVLSPTYADVTEPVYRRAQGRWRNYQKYLEPHVATLDPFIRAFGYE